MGLLPANTWRKELLRVSQSVKTANGFWTNGLLYIIYTAFKLAVLIPAHSTLESLNYIVYILGNSRWMFTRPSTGQSKMGGMNTGFGLEGDGKGPPLWMPDYSTRGVSTTADIARGARSPVWDLMAGPWCIPHFTTHPAGMHLPTFAGHIIWFTYMTKWFFQVSVMLYIILRIYNDDHDNDNHINNNNNNNKDNNDNDNNDNKTQ